MRSKILEQIKERPVLTGSSSALAGALAVWVIAGLGEADKQDTEILRQLAELSHQVTVSLERHDDVLSEIRHLGIRMDGIETRLGALEDDQTDLQEDHIRLKGRMVDIANDLSKPVNSSAESLVEIAREIMKMQREGRHDVWLVRGPPWARIEILEARLGRNISADERDQAVALVLFKAMGSR